MLYKLINSLILFLLISFCAVAQGEAYITVQFSNPEMKKRSVILNTFKDFTQNNISGIEQSAAPEGTGVYKFHVTGIKRYQQFEIFVGQNRLMTNYVEAGDNVKIEFSAQNDGLIKAKDFTFSGHGSAKLTAGTIALYTPIQYSVKIDAHRKFDQIIIDSLLNMVKTLYQSQLPLISGFQSDINGSIYKQLQTDLYCKPASFALGYFARSRTKYFSPEDLYTFIDNLKKNLPSHDTRILSQSGPYLSLMIQAASQLVSYKQLKPQDRPLAMCNELIRINKGLIREKTLMEYLCLNEYLGEINDADRIYARALQFIKLPVYRNYLQTLAATRKRGAIPFNFSLPDNKGRKVNLADFKGKVVMIDNWFTGCTSCAGMAKRIEREVLPVFINNPDVVFVNVCADREKTLWLKSVESGQYTHPGSINLFTEGLGINHPYMKKYSFVGFPTFMLIGRDGRMFCSSMPRASNQMIAMINEALKQ